MADTRYRETSPSRDLLLPSSNYTNCPAWFRRAARNLERQSRNPPMEPFLSHNRPCRHRNPLPLLGNNSRSLGLLRGISQGWATILDQVKHTAKTDNITVKHPRVNITPEQQRRREAGKPRSPLIFWIKQAARATIRRTSKEGAE